VGVVVQRDDGCKTTVKGNDGDGWSSDGVVLGLGRRQNRDTVEWSRLRSSFYSGGGWESGGPRRVACGGGANSMLHFWFEGRDNGTKCCRKMNWGQRTHLGSMRRKRDMVRQCDNVDRRSSDNE
jgi:hypothetical protein